MALAIDEEYIIITKTTYKNKIQIKTYSGIYNGHYSSGHLLFMDVGRVNKPYNIKYNITLMRIFNPTDQYIKLHEMIEIIEKSTQAKKNMENRALKMILKKIINDEFEW